MWDFPRYTSREQAFSFSRGVLETAGAGAGARASRTALKIRCKSFSEYLGVLVSVGDFGLGSPSGCLEFSDSGGEKESRGVTEEVTERITERRSRQGRSRPWTEIISELELIFF